MGFLAPAAAAGAAGAGAAGAAGTTAALAPAVAPTVAGASALYPAAGPLAGASMLFNPGTAGATAGAAGGGLAQLYPTAGALSGASQMFHAAPSLGAMTGRIAPAVAPAAAGGAGMLGSLTPNAALALGQMAGGMGQQPRGQQLQRPPARALRPSPTQLQAAYAGRVPAYRRF